MAREYAGNHDVDSKYKYCDCFLDQDGESWCLYIHENDQYKNVKVVKYGLDKHKANYWMNYSKIHNGFLVRNDIKVMFENRLDILDNVCRLIDVDLGNICEKLEKFMENKK